MICKMEFNFFDEVIIRTPAISCSGMLTKEQLYFANPELLNLKMDVEKEKYAFLKYLYRSRYRCTPFGLFAGLHVGTLGTHTKVLLDSCRAKRHLRLDVEYVCSLIEYLLSKQSILNAVKFFPNNSIYNIGKKIRYIEYISTTNGRKHVLSSIVLNKNIQNILDYSIGGLSINEICCILPAKYSLRQREDFIHKLISCKLLISELEPATIGPEIDKQLLYQLYDIANRNQDSNDEIRQVINTLEDVFDILNRCQYIGIDDRNISNYNAIYSLLTKLNAPINKKKFLQNDLIKTPIVSIIDKSLLPKIKDAVYSLIKLSTHEENINLKRFKEHFVERWGDSGVPLNIVLDNEIGLGYPSSLTGNDNNAVLDKIPQPLQYTHHTKLEISKPLFSFWIDRLFSARQNNQYILNVLDDEIKNLPNLEITLPDTFSVIVTLLGETSSPMFQVKSAITGLGTSLIGRFCHSDNNVYRLAQKIVQKEENLHGDKILAEVCHLPFGRVGNILQSPKLRDYSIPCICKSGKTQEIGIEDIIVTVDNNKIRLFSNSLKVEILPRLASAYNHNHPLSIPLMKFLGDLQYQGVANYLNLDMSLFSDLKFIPRIVYNNIAVISPATWFFNKEDYALLLKKYKQSASVFQEFKHTWSLPRYIAIEEGDNELIIDLENQEAIDLFIFELNKRKQIKLVEFIFNEATAIVKDANGESYTNEIVLTCFSKEIPRKNKVISMNYSPEQKCNIGGEWLYFKIYIGKVSAEDFIVNELSTMCSLLYDENLIDKYFFIRYADPGFHIRLRLHLHESINIGGIISLINQKTDDLVKNNIISNVVIDSYTREVDRYDKSNIVNSEQIFFIDSKAILQLLSILQSFDEKDYMRLKIAMKVIDNYLDLFRCDIFEKRNFCNGLTKIESFKLYSNNKTIRKAIDKQYRNSHEEINFFLRMEEKRFAAVFEKMNFEIYPFVQFVLDNYSKTRQFDLVANYIHMSLNRLFKSQNTFQEYIVYCLLEKHYRYIIGRLDV